MQDSNKKNKKISVGLDIGTTKVCAVVLTEGDKGGTYKIIGCATTVNVGVNRGVIVNIEKTVSAIKNVIGQVEQQSGVTVKDVVVGIAGDHIESLSEISTIAISNQNQIVTKLDVERVIDELRKSKISSDRKIIHIVPYEYIIDGQDGITQPIGMCGVRLQANVHIVTGLKTAVQNIHLCVENNADLAVKDIILEPIASSLALLNEDEKEVGICLIDIGGGTTDITIFKDDVLRYTSVIAIGGNKITDDVRTGFGTTKVEAERIKCNYGHSFKPSILTKDELIMIKGVGGYPHKEIKKEDLCDIIQPRVEEIFEMCKEELIKSKFADSLGAGIVLTGGTALLKGVDELASRVFNAPVRIGYPSGEKYTGLSVEVETPIYSTAVGLALHSFEIDAIEEATSGTTVNFDKKDDLEEKNRSEKNKWWKKKTKDDNNDKSDKINNEDEYINDEDNKDDEDKQSLLQKAKDFITKL